MITEEAVQDLYYSDNETRCSSLLIIQELEGIKYAIKNQVQGKQKQVLLHTGKAGL